MKIAKIIVLLALPTILMAACGNQADKMEEKMSSSSSVVDQKNDSNNREFSAAGNFSSEKNHSVKGDIKIEGGKLMLSNFSTDEGPDLYVYLAKGKNIDDAKQIAKIDLTSENQSFELNNVDAENYDTVLIYCNKAHELFGSGSYEN